MPKLTDPFYSDDAVTLYEGDSAQVLPTLELTGDVHLLTDPPYFEVKDEDWDNQWDKSAEFLEWLGGILDLVKPHLSANGSVWVFTSPQLNTAVELVVSSRFRVLNNVRWVKEQGWHQKADLSQARRFLTAWEGIIFAEQFGDAYGAASQALHREVFAPVGRYLQTEREASGVSRKVVAESLAGYKNMDSATANVSNWELGKNLISEPDYLAFRNALGSGYLRREYEDLRREYEDLRRTFTVDKTRPTTDVWNFGTVAPYPGKHPCEKPQALLHHMIETTTRPGDTILDPFAGSGAVLQAARDLGRKAVGIEQDPKWCAHAERRLSQQTFNLGVLA